MTALSIPAGVLNDIKTIAQNSRAQALAQQEIAQHLATLATVGQSLLELMETWEDRASQFDDGYLSEYHEEYRGRRVVDAEVRNAEDGEKIV
jgi:hypothetical protein